MAYGLLNWVSNTAKRGKKYVSILYILDGGKNIQQKKVGNFFLQDFNIAIIRDTTSIIYIHSCQKVNLIVNWFLIFLYHVLNHIVYCKIHKHLINFIKNYKYTYIKGIFIINFEYI